MSFFFLAAQPLIPLRAVGETNHTKQADEHRQE
jgi:hypothetical protein